MTDLAALMKAVDVLGFLSVYPFVLFEFGQHKIRQVLNYCLYNSESFHFVELFLLYLKHRNLRLPIIFGVAITNSCDGFVELLHMIQI